jgi:hypothetical protein
VRRTYVSGELTGMTTELVLYGFRRADRGAAPPSGDDRRPLADVAVQAVAAATGRSVRGPRRAHGVGC